MKNKIPLSWPTYSFKEVAEVITGTTPSTNHPEYYGGFIPFIGPAELGGVEPITKSSKNLSDEGAKQARLLPKEAVLICCIGATIGKIGFSGTKLATNQQINALVCNNNIVFPRYLFYYCRTLESLFRHQGSSTTLPLLPKGRFQEIKIPLPPLEEQKKIAEILDQAEELRRKRKEAIAQLDTLTQSIFIEMFGDPVKNPKGWKTKSLRDICDEINDCPHSTPSWTKNGVICLRTSNLTKGGWNWDDTRFVSNETYHERSKRGYILPNDIILSREGTVGIAAIVTSEIKVCMGQRLVQVRPSFSVLTSEFTLQHLLYALDPTRIGKLMVGSTSQHLNVKELRDLKIPLSPLSLQKEFTQRVEAIEELKKSHRASLSELDALFASLQHRAFRGEL
jgi:type I restriction enzyme S subunit